jgi:cytochrome c
MKKNLVLFFTSLVLLTLIIPFNTQAASPEDAKALAKAAAAYVRTNGKEKGIAEISNPKGQFVKGDIYVVLQSFQGINLANAMQPKLAGMNHLELKDVNGKYFIKEMIEIAKTKGNGWCEYYWANPATNKVQLKKSWVERVEGTDLFVLCGIYQ